MKAAHWLTALCLSALVGCTHHVPVSNTDVHLAIEQSHTVVKAGETVTFTARASGVSGRKDEIKWSSSGGDLSKPNDMERYAQVHYEKPGVYTVAASLYLDGSLVDKEMATVQVDPLE